MTKHVIPGKREDLVPAMSRADRLTLGQLCQHGVWGKLDDVYGRLSDWLSAGVGVGMRDEWLPRQHSGGCIVCCGKIGEPGNFFLLSTRGSYLRNSLVLGVGGWA